MRVSMTNSTPSSRVTIRDVARVSGVSRQTVTRAINGMPDISDSTRERVMRTVEELGYRPNRFAIDLSRQRTRSVGLIIPTFKNPYYAQLADAFINELQTRKWQVMVGTSDQGEKEAIQSMADQVDAIVGYFLEPSAIRGVPIVQLEQRASHPGVHSVEIDLQTGVVELVRALRAKGACRFGMVDAAASRRDSLCGSPRWQYFKQAVGSSTIVVTEPESITGGLNGFRKLLAQDPEIDTVLAFNDLMAMGALQGAHSMNVDVPGEVRIVGIDGSFLGEALSPTLTSLSMEFKSIAVEAASIIAELFDGESMASESINRIVKPTVLWRESA